LKPFLGSGPRTFVFATLDDHTLLPYERQPVHNSLLLIAAEFGLPLALYAIVLLFTMYVYFASPGRSILVAITFLASLDHYLITGTTGLNVLTLAAILVLCSQKITAIERSEPKGRENSRPTTAKVLMTT